MRDGKRETVEAIIQNKLDGKNTVLLVDVTESPTLCVVTGYFFVILLFSATFCPLSLYYTLFVWFCCLTLFVNITFLLS